MRPTLNILSDELIGKILDEAMRVMAETGSKSIPPPGECCFRRTSSGIRVSIFQVPIESDRVEWDGAKQEIAYEGCGKKYTANISVSSVAMEIYD